MNGKMIDVLIEDVYYKDDTGVRSLGRSITVWADEGAEEIIERIDGITNVFHLDKNEYTVYLDPRYDREYIKAEIEARIKIELE